MNISLRFDISQSVPFGFMHQLVNFHQFSQAEVVTLSMIINLTKSKSIMEGTTQAHVNAADLMKSLLSLIEAKKQVKQAAFRYANPSEPLTGTRIMAG